MTKTVRVRSVLSFTYRGPGDDSGLGIPSGEEVEVSEESAAYLVEVHGFVLVDPPKPKRKTRKRGATRGAAPE